MKFKIPVYVVDNGRRIGPIRMWWRNASGITKGNIEGMLWSLPIWLFFLWAVVPWMLDNV